MEASKEKWNNIYLYCIVVMLISLHNLIYLYHYLLYMITKYFLFDQVYMYIFIQYMENKRDIDSGSSENTI